MENLQTTANKYFDRKPRRNIRLTKHAIVSGMQKNSKHWSTELL